MSNKENQKSTKEQWYVEIDGEEIPVSEEVYRAYKRPAWAESKRKKREKRCMISDGKGKTKRCMEDCSQCNRSRTGSVLSLDRLEEEGFGTTDHFDMEEYVADKIILDELYSALKELDPYDQRLIQALFYDNRSSRDYSAEIGKSHQTINNHRERAIERLRLIMKVRI